MTAFVDRRSSSRAGARPIGRLYEHQRPVPAGWANLLAAHFPRRDDTSSLLIRWEPGDPWEPVQRYCIWHVLPLKLIANRRELAKELQGPHPRSTGHYCASGWCPCPVKANRYIGGACGIIDRATWELFHETGLYGRRYWMIQGTTGGHRHRLDTIERKIARIKTGHADTPAPGDLPYADFDGRVLAKLIEADKLRIWKHYLDFTRRNHAQMDAEQRALEIEGNRLIWNWLDGQVDAAVTKMGQAGRKTLAESAHRQLAQGDKHFDYDKIEEDFITTPHIAA